MTSLYEEFAIAKAKKCINPLATAIQINYAEYFRIFLSVHPMTSEQLYKLMFFKSLNLDIVYILYSEYNIQITPVIINRIILNIREGKYQYATYGKWLGGSTYITIYDFQQFIEKIKYKLSNLDIILATFYNYIDIIIIVWKLNKPCHQFDIYTTYDYILKLSKNGYLIIVKSLVLKARPYY